MHCTDALPWLRECALGPGHAMLTSLPDRSELRRMPLADWQRWFVDAAELVLRATPESSAAIFYQTDVHDDGQWIDKAFLVQQAAVRTGDRLLWHKIVCRAPAGVATPGRPGYAHLLCFSRTLRHDPQHAAADVLPQLGPMTWARAMGVFAVEAAVQWLLQAAGAHTIVDPFCGVGTALAVANRLGLHAVGVERSPKRAEAARSLQA